MATSNRIVNISVDPIVTRQRRRRAMLRVGIPILGVALVIVAILAITFYSLNANRRGVLALSDQFFDTLDAEIAQQVSFFLAPGERAIRIMRDMADSTPTADRLAVTERYAISVLKEVPQVAAFYWGNRAGEFAMVRRHGNGVAIKEIVNEQGRHVVLIERNSAGEEISRREDPTDTYDPRTRPWFKGAQGTDDIFWTGVYTFYTDRKRGVTASIRVPELIRSGAVLGVDIELEDLSRFLSTLGIGKGWRVVILDHEGHVVATSGSHELEKRSGDELIPPKVEELGDVLVTAAFDRFRVEGQGWRIIKHEGTSYISSATQLTGRASSWWVLVVVPESDFVGFVASNYRKELAMSLVIVAAVVVLAVLLVRQGLRSDSSIRRVSERELKLSRQSAAYTAIADKLADRPGETPQALTEGLADVTGAPRVSIWRLAKGKHTLNCWDCYDQDSRAHTSGFELQRREMPAFFDLLESSEEVSIVNASVDRRCAQFHASIMQSLGSSALTLVPLRRSEQIAGAICLEDAGPIDGARDFMQTSAALAYSALRATEIKSQDPGATPVRASRDHVPRELPVQPIPSTDLAPTPAERASLRSEYFPEVAVMALCLSGALGMAKKCGGAESSIAAQISECLQEVAAEHGITYLKFVGHDVTAAAGFDRPDAEAMAAVAELAIAVQERLSRLIERSDRTAEFRIGLAFGGCYGCLLGRECLQFNLWGDALETAELMAHSASSSSIQASAGAYTKLRQDFLFRPRGSFYQPGIGQLRSFVLAGQI